MKKLILIIASLAAWAWSQQLGVTGQRIVQRGLVKWSASGGTWTGKTRLRILQGAVYVDTSTTGQAGQWKRIDNGADSCSQAFLIAGDSLGGLRPVWEFRLWAMTKAATFPGSVHTYRIQTREAWVDAQGIRRFTPWSYKGSNAGYADVTVQDSILMPDMRITGTKAGQYALGFVAGTQARLCPDNTGDTATGAGDSVIVDSLLFFAR